MGIYSGVFVGVALLLTPILGSAGYIVSSLLCMSENRSFPYSIHSLLCHLSVGIVAGISMLGLLYVFDRKLIREDMKILRNKQE